MISQGEIWWADLPEPAGSGSGFRRPVVVLQSDAFNRSSIRTVVCVPLTTQMKWASSPGNVALSKRLTGLPKESVANVSQIVTIDKQFLTERAGKLPHRNLQLILLGVGIILGQKVSHSAPLTRWPSSSFALQSKSFPFSSGVAGNTLCCGAGIGRSPMRSFQRALLSSVVSTASAWLKSRFFPALQSFVFIS